MALAASLSLAAVFLALLAQPATAQVGEAPLRVVVAAFDEPLHPAREARAVNVSGDVACRLAQPIIQNITLSFHVLEAPAWSDVRVSPPVVLLDVDGCVAGRIPFEAQLVAGANETAPAWRAADVRIEARTEGAFVTEAKAEGATRVVAGFFPLVLVHVDEPILHGAPGANFVVPVKVENLGNAATRVELSLANVTDASVKLPAAVTLGSRQQDDAENAATLTLGILAPTEPDTRPIHLRVASWEAADPNATRTYSNLTLVIDTRAPGALGGHLDAAMEAPAPGVVTWLLAAGTVTLAMRRGRGA